MSEERCVCGGVGKRLGKYAPTHLAGVGQSTDASAHAREQVLGVVRVQGLCRAHSGLVRPLDDACDGIVRARGGHSRHEAE